MFSIFVIVALVLISLAAVLPLPSVLLCVAIFVGYFLPAIIAMRREHCDAAAIVVLNLLLGWTLLAWILALVWSLTGNTKTKARWLTTGRPPDDDGIGRWVDPQGRGRFEG
jgi:hypothetical protein